MAKVHLDESALKRQVAATTGAAGLRAALAIRDAVRAQGITVGDKDGGASEIRLPVRVYRHGDGDAGRDMVQYTTKAGTSRLATRAQAEAWGGSYEEITRNPKSGISVVLNHPAGVAVQAKHGALTKGAASAGFEVHS